MMMMKKAWMNPFSQNCVAQFVSSSQSLYIYTASHEFYFIFIVPNLELTEGEEQGRMYCFI